MGAGLKKCITSTKQHEEKENPRLLALGPDKDLSEYNESTKTQKQIDNSIVVEPSTIKIHQWVKKVYYEKPMNDVLFYNKYGRKTLPKVVGESLEMKKEIEE